MILSELKQVMPSFVSRVERPDRGGEWVAYLEDAPRGDRALGRPPGPRPPRAAPTSPSVELVHVDGTEEDLLAASLFESAGASEARDPPADRRCSTRRAGASCSPSSSASARNRRHRPGRGWEALRYRFEIVSDYGGFRDLQRHRMLTCQWQRLGPDLGAGVPEEVREAGVGDDYERALEISRAEFERLEAARAGATPPPTRSASATGSATCST